uniref:hypothetical chloroplast RF19 n=1 Tax=Plantago camtschatica TaxID=223176 RepID=UPI001BEFE6B3|nr:hypothetical chloroplast RF19 [Plantago sp. JP-2021]QTZ18863.1 hypothetical chloroplast RF19 [Plantago sp. JP-2021]QWL16275.1 hypothetical chloroplast RF19 [Plantago depressa]QWL16295.1 hypothetical chloroplast RF19 [Plantago depressa]
MQHLYFLFGSWIPFCIKLVNSVVVVGLYYGFLTTFSVGPSYLFLLRAQVMEKGMEKRVAATTGFISGQFIMFLSIYYPPMHLALGQPHTITVLALSYLLVHLFNDKDFLDNESSSRNSLSNFSTQSVFVNNLIFQLFHHYLFPSSMLARLVNVYLFRCNNKILFLTSSFVGWLIGWVICHILFRKWLGSGLVWIQQNNLIKSNKFIRSNKYLVAKLRIRIFSILLFMTCAYSLSRIPFPIKPSTKTEEIDVEIETSDEEDPSSFSEERADPNKIDETEEIRVNSNKNHENSTIFPKKMANNDPFFFEKNLATLLFDFNQWNRPLRYIKNDKFEQAIRNEMSHYFFDRCKSDGKYRMTFTCPASVSIFLERLKRRLLSPELWPYFFDDNPPDPYDFWIFTNEKKERKEKKAFLNRIKSLDKKSSFLNRLETRTRLCNDDSRNKYLPKRYDPLLSGSRRKTIEKNAILKKTSKKKFFQNFRINKLHQILVPYTDKLGEFIEIQNKERKIYAEDIKNEELPIIDKIVDTVIEKFLPPVVDTFRLVLNTHKWICLARLQAIVAGNIHYAIAVQCTFWRHTAPGTSYLSNLIGFRNLKNVCLKCYEDILSKSHFNWDLLMRTGYAHVRYEHMGYLGDFIRKIEYALEEKLDEYYAYLNFGCGSLVTSWYTLDWLDQNYYQNKKKFEKEKSEKEKFEKEKFERPKAERAKLEKLKRKHEMLFFKKVLFFLHDDANDANSQNRNISQNKINEISKKIPRWEYKLITELEQQSGEFQDIPEDFEIRSREAKEVVIFTDIKDDKDDPDEMEEMSTTRYLEQPDFDRDLIKGSVRAQRRKVVIWKVFQGNAHSPLFVYRIKKSIFFSLTSNMFELIKSIFRNRVWKGEAFQIVESTNEQTKREENRIEIEDEDEEKKEMEILEEEARMKIAEAWDNAHTYGQGIRACLLLIQSIFRKYILLPSFIIAKNLGRISLSQRPEWSEDFREWNREMHLKCTYNGTPLSETELPENWFIEGLQIKILFPFRLKPSHKRKLRSYQEKEDFRFLTVFGLEAKHPFGFPEKRPSFWKPVLKELGKKVRKMKKNYFKGKKKRLAKVSKENPIQLRKVEIYESNEIQEEKDSIISNQIINQSFGQTVSPGLTNSSLTEKKIKDLTERIGKIRNQIERIERIRKKKRKNDTSPNKTFNAKFLEKWKIFKRRTVRFISKFPLYLKIFIELLSRHRFFSRSEWKLSGVWKSTIYYIEEFVLFSKFYLLRIWKFILYIMFEGWFKIYYILLCIVRDIRFILNFVVDHSNLDISTQIRLRTLIDKMMNNCIELIFLSLDLTFKNTSSNKKKKNLIPFKKSLDKIRDMKSNLHIFFDLSCVSQAYVFYKLSQMQVSNLHKLRPVLQYQGISLFLKPEIKDSLEKQGMVHSKLKLNDKKLRNYEQNQWKKWLRGYSPYNLSSIIWSRLMPEKWRNTSHCIATKEKLSKCNSYETDQVSDSKKKREVYKLANQKENFHKSYRYDLLANKFLNSEKFQGNKNGELSCNTHKDPLYDILKTTPIYNYVDMLAVEKMVNRKYLRWKSLYRKEKVDIESCITIDANRNPNIQRETNKYFQISIKNGYSEICYFRLPDNLPKFHNVFVDWMGMNERMLNYSISNLEGWFFPELVLFHQAYKTKPWFRPNQLLLLNRNGNENSSEKKKIKFKKKQGNQEEPKKGEDFGSVLSQEKSSEENSVKLDRKKKKKKKSQLDSFLERYLLFQCKWWDSTLDEKLMNNIEVYCLLLRLMDPRKILLSSIQTREIDLDRLTIQTSLTHAELLKKGILIIEPIRLFGKIDGQLLMYQTISTSLVDKSKYQTNPKYQEERYVSKNYFDFLIPENILSFRHRRKLRILISLNSKYRNDENRILLFWNEKNRKNSNQASPENKGLNIEENALMKLKLFLWPNYRLEDLACMNRYWFNTNNGSRFSMLRIHLYPRLKMENS